MKLNSMVCSKARHSRDPRFDGKFFTAVKTTKIYCRSICPATTPLEKNVIYFATAIEAANAGFRPCLRCRPDSAPNSPAWKGVDTTLERAITLINDGALQNGSIELLAQRLGISDRYLRQLFQRHLGISPKSYALYQQCLFAKTLLHQTTLPITQVALASGFNSIRRFNDCFQNQLALTPSSVRKGRTNSNNVIQLMLYYRPPYNWLMMQRFLSARVINNLEWCDDNRYGRTFEWRGASGYFTAEHSADKYGFSVSLVIDNLSELKPVINNIRRILDLDVDMQMVEKDLQLYFGDHNALISGLRLPGTWSLFEAGMRAILGQQISVVAAGNLVAKIVSELGEPIDAKFEEKPEAKRLFPSPEAIVNSSLDFFKMPQSRKNTLKNLAQYYIDNDNPNDPIQWLSLKGIGPWTVNYAKMRGLSDPDVFLGDDLGIKKALNQLGVPCDKKPEPSLASPWQSYLTIQLWTKL